MKAFLISLTLAFTCLCKLSIAQDTINKNNHEMIIAKILEISANEVRYIRLELPEGPVYSISKDQVLSIHYKNGELDEFNKIQQTFHENPKPAEPNDMSPRYLLTLSDGSQLHGKILRETKTETVFLDDNIGEKKIRKSAIKSIRALYGDDRQVFTLTDGSIVTGRIITKSNDAIVIETNGLGIVTLEQSKISKVKPYEEATITSEGKIWYKNPNCTRYLFAPSAIPLKKGEGYYQNIYGAGNAVNFGLNNNLSIGGGMLGPMGAYVNTKLGFKINNMLHIGVGAIAGNGFFPVNGNNLGIGLGFGVITLGNYDHNITVGSGYGIINSGGKTGMLKKPLFVANGMARLAKKFALVSENWVVNVEGRDLFNTGIHNGQHYETFFSYAFRYMGEKSTLDAGFVNTPGLIRQGWYIGIPYIGFVIRFGNYKDQ